LEITDGIIECDDEYKDSDSEIQMDITTSSDDISDFVEKTHIKQETIRGVNVDPDYFKFQEDPMSMIRICPILLNKEYEAYYEDLILKSQGTSFFLTKFRLRRVP
jgi:hypothetical protein